MRCPVPQVRAAAATVTVDRIAYCRRNATATITDMTRFGCPTGTNTSNCSIHIPRSSAPALVTNNQDSITGISAFAFQGTNAHVLLGWTRLASGRTHQQAAPPCWQRKRVWLMPVPHQLLMSAEWHAPVRMAVFSLQLQQAAAAFIWDHQVPLPLPLVQNQYFSLPVVDC